ncbi:M15 family metallopeptidase [Lachnotalea glycerini]|uniref:D-alanyl-D-alanine carboxypeptidase family protein n=1 Tax=Lachnotalea glycerini TaxID=1763509 RepID=A0A371JI27_9FIRM|nr:M15 family metallopeptidase [Lachnotalea glycerini]RDY32374.1 D-alanyl-D-alanine carboxypeptidase family protein [Lachnotalea glycerini]
MKITLLREAIHAGNLILVNQSYAYQENHNRCLLTLVEDKNNILMEHTAARALSLLMHDINGWPQITAVSGYRTLKEQQTIFQQSLQEQGAEFTEKFVALPGHSEHQTGLAIDLGIRQENINFICPEFPYTGICQTFRERAAHFGFIERYPMGKENITKIAHEPWHFRYVGIPHAAIIVQNKLTLEEYTSFLKQYPFGNSSYTYKNTNTKYYISYQKGIDQETAQLEMDINAKYLISGNNVDGFVITEWRK